MVCLRDARSTNGLLGRHRAICWSAWWTASLWNYETTPRMYIIVAQVLLVVPLGVVAVDVTVLVDGAAVVAITAVVVEQVCCVWGERCKIILHKRKNIGMSGSD